MPQESKFYKFFHVYTIARALNIQSDKLYNNLKGNYDSLHKDKDRIAKFMIPHVEQFFTYLGWSVVFKKLNG